MSQNQKNICKNMDNTNQKNFEKEYFNKRIVLINQIENEKIPSISYTPIAPSNTPFAIF